MHLYRLAIFIASILLVDAAYLSGNLSISYDPKPTLMFSTFAVKVDAKPNDKGCYIHKMAAGETCAYLIDKFTNVKSISNLNSWNKDTPGWEGCDNGHPWAGDEVCVSTGGYPDKRPSKNSDGSCKIHVIKSGESCGVLDKMYYLKPGDMYKFNEDNPNWVSCQDGRPWVGDRVCVSEGTPPSKDVTTNPDGSCYSHELKAGETCADMDKMYGLGPGDMYTFNENTPRWTNCQSLYEGLNVCVSKGTPAGNSVSKNKDGSCYVHTVSKGETCGSIDKLYKLNGGDNYKFNKNTYMWQGCKNNHPWVGDKICVTEGNPPKPPIDKKAECGPTAAGKEYDVKCPLNACCSQFGFCGLTSEFCKKTDSLTGAPGTAGCISNCGYGKQHTDTRSDFDKIVYWMDSDGKMASDPKELENDYDIMHYAFVNINSDFSIDDSKIKASDFLNLNMKRVASFGGWDFSTNPSTYKIFRNIVSSSGNREKFATNVVNFLKKYNLDGIDLDWEYPGAPDIPGIPADNPTNGKNYNELLKLIKSKLPSGKTLSIAIPASYWYLKNYPIKDMQANIDYQVFMTYDIHGTWDLDKDPHVKCHTNKTEVIDALKMLDKAGVQIGKTYGGIANYGRSYKLSSSSCTGVGCQFSGGGDKGPITETAGVLALSEIDDINSWATKGKRWTDAESQCDFMTYNDNSVVAWPKAGQRDSMENMFHNSGLKGSVLWAGNYFKHDEYSGCDVLKHYPFGEEKISEDCDIYQQMIDLGKEVVKTFKDKVEPNLQEYLKQQRESLINKSIKNNSFNEKEARNLFKNTEILIKQLENKLNVNKKVSYKYIYRCKIFNTALLEFINNKNKRYDIITANTDQLTSIIDFTNPSLLSIEVEAAAVALGTLLIAPAVVALGAGAAVLAISFVLMDKNQYETTIDIDTEITVHLENGEILTDDLLSIINEQTNKELITDIPDQKTDVTTASSMCSYDTCTGDGCGMTLFSAPIDQLCVRIQNRVTYNVGNIQRVRMLQSRLPNPLPLYIININNQSHGVACNAMQWVTQKSNFALNTDEMLEMTYIDINERTKKRGVLMKGVTRSNTRNNNEFNFAPSPFYQNDEFPFNSVEEGYNSKNGKYDVSIMYIDAADNWIDGQNIERFYGATKPGKSTDPKSEKYVKNDWRYLIPNDSNSGEREGSLLNKGKFYVLINLPDDIDCSKYMKLPTGNQVNNIFEYPMGQIPIDPDLYGLRKLKI